MWFLRFFARYLYVPAMLLGFVGLAVYLMGNGYHYPWLAFVILAAIGLSFSMELVLPYEEEWNRTHDDIGKDVAHGVVYELGNLVTLGLLLLISLGLPALDLWPSSLPFAVQFLLALLIADCVMTMIHYLSHRVGWLWKFHSIHHGVSRLYGLNGFVRHPLHQAIDVAFGTLPLVVAGLPVPVAAALGVAIAIQLNLQHAKRELRDRAVAEIAFHRSSAPAAPCQLGRRRRREFRAVPHAVGPGARHFQAGFGPGAARRRYRHSGLPAFPAKLCAAAQDPVRARVSVRAAGDAGRTRREAARRRSRRDDLKRKTARGEAHFARA